VTRSSERSESAASLALSMTSTLPDALVKTALEAYAALPTKVKPSRRGGGTGTPEWTVLASFLIFRAGDKGDEGWEVRCVSLGYVRLFLSKRFFDLTPLTLAEPAFELFLMLDSPSTATYCTTRMLRSSLDEASISGCTRNLSDRRQETGRASSKRSKGKEEEKNGG
jgi:hypothetical protein